MFALFKNNQKRTKGLKNAIKTKTDGRDRMGGEREANT